MPDTYDLEALLWEIRVLAREHGFDGRDASRISALVLDRLGCATASEAYDRLYADWRKLPVGTMPSGLRAGQILRILPMLHYDQPVTDLGREDELRRAAREYGPPDENWQGMTTAASGWHGMQQITDPADLRTALTRLEEDRSHHPPGSPMRDVVDWQYAGLRAHLAQTTGGEDEFDAAVADLARLTGSPVFDEQTRILMAGQLATLRMHQAVRDGDEALLGEQIQALEGVLAQLPPDHADRLTMQSNLEAATTGLALLRAQRTGSFATAVDGMPAGISVQEVRRQTAALPRNIRAHQLGEMGHSQVGRALLTQDHQAALDGMRLFEDALELLEPDDDRWLRNAGGLGTAHCALAVLEIAPPHTRAHHLDQGIAWLRHLWRLTAGPHHSLWGVTGLSLARAYRHRGDAQPRRSRARRANHDEARRIGLESLRAASWSVLLQSGTAHAAAAARLAGEQAAEVARWCLADGAHTEAVRALDAGRALALHAATVSATVPDLLTALGQVELADEWRQSGDMATPEPGGEAALLTGGFLATGRSSRLRHRVLRALAASPLRQRLLDAPSPEEIGEALRALGASALVYLLPGEVEPPSPGDQLFRRERHIPGAALLVTADGGTRTLELPDLTLDAPPLAAYRASGTPGRDAGGPPTADTAPGPVPRPDHSRAALERLCDWAGATVMRPLLAELPRGYGRVPSVILVPMAALGAVPWHAARLTGRRGFRRHACEEAHLSYLPSARLLCEVAARPAAGARQALVVGDPTRDLHHAGEEAEAIHRVFHPHGDLLGPGTATPAAVTGWLRRQRGGLLHLACHGVVRQGERHSAYLALSGGELAAEELTEGEPRYRGLDLVVLAACRTNVSGRGYDEAYSLSTAFLVAGARSVIGSLWPVPDEATSLLMYMTHHFLSRDGLPPGQALRAAQLWMLDDRREPPPGMPGHLCARVRHIRGDDLTAWAGFTHLGW